MSEETTSRDSYAQMLAMVQSFHDKHDFSGTGGEDMVYRIALMAEELGEMSSCVTKGKGMEEMAEETADLLILVMGTAIAGNFDLLDAMDKLMKRNAKMIDGRIRVSEFRGQE
jgi:NTP pyrophosphatase (non-canonical NTP hydrolase)